MNTKDAVDFARVNKAPAKIHTPTEARNLYELTKLLVRKELAEPSQAELDAALEREIDNAHLAYLRAVELDDVPSIRECFDVMAELVEQRSPQRIAEMESRLPDPWRS